MSPDLVSSTTLIAASARETGQIIAAVVGGLFALISLLKLIQRAQFRREMEALRAFQEGALDDDDEREVKTVRRGRLLRKMRPTKSLIEFTATKDSWFDPPYLKEVSKEVFKQLREAWEESDFELLKGYVTADFYDEYLENMNDKRKKAPISFADLRLKRLEIVHFNAGSKKENHTFTVLVTAESMFVDEEEDEDADDQEIVAYQEFWTFKRRKRWQLARMRDIGNSDALLEQNVLQIDWFKEFRDQVCKKRDELDFVIPS